MTSETNATKADDRTMALVSVLRALMVSHGIENVNTAHRIARLLQREVLVSRVDHEYWLEKQRRIMQVDVEAAQAAAKFTKAI